jgi:hypothetical protein
MQWSRAYFVIVYPPGENNKPFLRAIMDGRFLPGTLRALLGPRLKPAGMTAFVEM